MKMRYKDQSARSAYIDIEPYGTGREFIRERIMDLAGDMNINLDIRSKFSKKKEMVRRALGKGTPLSALVIESRER